MTAVLRTTPIVSENQTSTASETLLGEVGVGRDSCSNNTYCEWNSFRVSGVWS